MIQFMKKCVVLILALAYLFSGTGMLLKQHFCGGEFVSEEIDFRDIAPPSIHEFSCPASDDKDSCCATHVKLIKKNQDQKVAASIDWAPLEVCYLGSNLPIAYPSIAYFSDVAADLLPLQKPPPKSIPIYVSFCTWLI